MNVINNVCLFLGCVFYHLGIMESWHSRERSANEKKEKYYFVMKKE